MALLDGWRRTSLGSVLVEKPSNGYSPRCPNEPNGRWILSLGAVTERGYQPSAIKPAPLDDDKVSSFRLSPGDLIISRSNTRSRVGFAGIYSGVPSWCAYPDLLVRLRVNERMALTEYIEAFLLSPTGREYFQSTARGTSGSMVKINRSIIEQLEVLLPPLSEQRKIAAILSSVDEAIEKTQAVIDQVQVVKRGLMQELLTTGLPGRHKTFKQTEIGRIPEGWEVKRLGDISLEMRYGSSAKCTTDSSGDPVLRIPNVVQGFIDDGVLKYATLPASERERYLLRPGDLLFVRTNGNPSYVGRCAIMDGRDGAWLFASYLIRVRIDSQHAIPAFIHLSCMSGPTRDAMSGSIRTSAGNYNINTHGIASAILGVPPLEEQRELVNIASSIDARLTSEQQKMAGLQSLKSALQSLLLTGELRIRPDPTPEPS